MRRAHMQGLSRTPGFGSAPLGQGSGACMRMLQGMEAPYLVLNDPAIIERTRGIAEVLANHAKWLEQYTGILPDPDGVVEVGESFRNSGIRPSVYVGMIRSLSHALTAILDDAEQIDYLDTAIRHWRQSKNEKAIYYVDAFQSVRTSLFGATLPLDE